MEAWLDFGRGPLFRLCFALMILGLLRRLILTIVGMIEAHRLGLDETLPWGSLVIKFFSGLFPLGRFWSRRPVFGTISFAFHIGLIVVPLLLGAHILLWRRNLDFGWPALPQQVANWLTLFVIAAGGALLLIRLLHAGVRASSRRAEFMWPVLLLVPFATGYLCSNAAVEPKVYQWLMLLHVYAGNLIIALIPFTTITYCVLSSTSQFTPDTRWRFRAFVSDRIANMLGYANQPGWSEQANIAKQEPVSPREES